MQPLNPVSLTVSAPPHRHRGVTTQGRMLWLLLAMLPAAAMAVAHFGLPAFRVMALAASSAVLAEAAFDRLMDRASRIDDLHALTVGLSFAFLLPASAPWWLVAAGSASAIALGKMAFGGLGGSPFCASLIGWAVCRVSWPGHMDIDATMLAHEAAYPLAQLKNFGYQAVAGLDAGQLFLGRQLGGLGAVQIAGVAVGGILLLLRRSVPALIPAGVICGVAITAGLFHYADPQAYAPPLFHLLTGSALFAAFFLATDGPSSPSLPLPMLLYGLFAGALIVVIRVYGAYPDGVPFALLLASLFTPALERIRPKPFGAK